MLSVSCNVGACFLPDTSVTGEMMRRPESPQRILVGSARGLSFVHSYQAPPVTVETRPWHILQAAIFGVPRHGWRLPWAVQFPRIAAPRVTQHMEWPHKRPPAESKRGHWMSFSAVGCPSNSIPRIRHRADDLSFHVQYITSPGGLHQFESLPQNSSGLLHRYSTARPPCSRASPVGDLLLTSARLEADRSSVPGAGLPIQQPARVRLTLWPPRDH